MKHYCLKAFPTVNLKRIISRDDASGTQFLEHVHYSFESESQQDAEKQALKGDLLLTLNYESDLHFLIAITL